MRGYGETNPPSWVLISGLLNMMDKKFAMKPSLGNACFNACAVCMYAGFETAHKHLISALGLKQISVHALVPAP